MKTANFACILALVATLGQTLAAVPAAAQPAPDRPPQAAGRKPPGPQAYSIEQAVSDQAQLHTIGFSALAFLTGDPGASSFMPPGKVSDYFGFQYMRDIDAAGKGHNPQFLDRVAGNVLRILEREQREAFEREANSEAQLMRDIALRRLPMIAAFHRQLNAQLPDRSNGLNQAAVVRFAGELFATDAELAYQRAAVFGRVAASLSAGQKSALGSMRFGDFNSWPPVEMAQYKLGRGTEKLVNVAYMTLASEFFSWYAGSLQADTYFCPERHGTYFGGFFLKDAPAMGKRDYDISTSLTGDLGETFLQTLTVEQRRTMSGILESQRKPLAEIVTVRRAVSAELRRFLKGETADHRKVLSLGRRYGELDGELAYLYAMAFARIGQSATAEQRKNWARLRNSDQFVAAPAYLYSDPLRQMPELGEAAGLFFAPR